MTDQAENSPAITDRFKQLAISVDSNTLDSSNLPGAKIGLRPLWDSTQIAYYNFTLQIVPNSDINNCGHLIQQASNQIMKEMFLLL